VFFVQLHFTTRVRYGFLSVQLNYTIRPNKFSIKNRETRKKKGFRDDIAKNSLI